MVIPCLYKGLSLTPIVFPMQVWLRGRVSRLNTHSWLCLRRHWLCWCVTTASTKIASSRTLSWGNIGEASTHLLAPTTVRSSRCEKNWRPRCRSHRWWCHCLSRISRSTSPCKPYSPQLRSPTIHLPREITTCTTCSWMVWENSLLDHIWALFHSSNPQPCQIWSSSARGYSSFLCLVLWHSPSVLRTTAFSRMSWLSWWAVFRWAHYRVLCLPMSSAPCHWWSSLVIVSFPWGSCPLGSSWEAYWPVWLASKLSPRSDSIAKKIGRKKPALPETAEMNGQRQCAVREKDVGQTLY